MRLKTKQHPMIQGWINYYSKFGKSSMSTIDDYINGKLLKWAMRKYKTLQRRKKRAGKWLRELYSQKPSLFAHWRGG
jgi:RNA-directed DNA polymerase